MKDGDLKCFGLTEELVLDVDKVLGVSNHFAIRVLDTVLGEDATGPICTTSHNLSMHGALIIVLRWTSRLPFQWSQRVVDVLSHRVFGALGANEIFVLALTTLQSQPIVTVIPLVFVALAEVPSQDEVLGYVVDARPDDTHGDVVPWHTAKVGFAEFVALPILDTLKVHDAVVIEVLTRPDFVLRTSRVYI